MTQERKRLGLAIPTVLYEKIANKAKYQGKTINAVCLEIFWDYFENKVSDSGTGKEEVIAR